MVIEMNVYGNSRLLVFADGADERAKALADRLGVQITKDAETARRAELSLCFYPDGLTLCGGGQSLKCDLTQLLPRLKPENLRGELTVKAAKIKGADRALTAVDATAGFGGDSLLLAAAGFSVRLYEYDPVISALLSDGLQRAAEVPQLAEIVGRMELFEEDSVVSLTKLNYNPDVILLDPMFPERHKSALVKKKFQLLHLLQSPCADEEALLSAALSASPKKIIIKRPLKGAYLAGVKPAFSLPGKAVRFDCIMGN